MSSNIYLSKKYIGQSHSECITLSDLSVILTNEELGICAQIVDEDGNICRFPGVERCEALCAEISVDRLRPVVKYTTTFHRSGDGQFMMLWTVRPDGHFWMDSWGFGAEEDESVRLYAYLNDRGEFTTPFRLYNIGYRNFAEHDT